MKRGTKLWAKPLLISVLMILASPLVTATVAGVATSSHKTGLQVRDANSPSVEDAQDLLNAYRANFRVERMDNTALHMHTFVQNPCFEHMGIGWRYGNDYIELIRAFSIASDELENYVVSEELEKRTSPFERGFYASCLRAPFYKYICQIPASEQIEQAIRSAHRPVLERWTTLYRAADRVACTDIRPNQAGRTNAKKSM